MHIKLTQIYIHKLKKIGWKKSDKWETGRLGTSSEEQGKVVLFTKVQHNNTLHFICSQIDLGLKITF